MFYVAMNLVTVVSITLRNKKRWYMFEGEDDHKGLLQIFWSCLHSNISAVLIKQDILLPAGRKVTTIKMRPRM